VEISSDEGPLFEGREIELGPRAGDFYVVKSGIEEGELVVTNGAFKIDSELQIQAKPSMMSPAGGVVGGGHQHGTAKPSVSRPTEAREPLEEGLEARQVLTPVYDAYFEVQMALAKDDLAAARESARDIADAVKNVDMKVFSPAGHDRWMEQSKELSKQAGGIAKADDIKTARGAFFYLSKVTIALHEGVGHAGNQPYNLTHCPMARDGDGAFWLQTADIVWNPYYGESMQRCGSIKETLEGESEGDD
jgi:Cu(I)/Ag(I) efflux system membrane fusion protein